jgi:AraC family transcriptional regulator of adaptative response / DNA-3-methyladenine glycosylase II
LTVRAILGQQVTVSAAIGLAAKLLAGYGEAAQPSTAGNARLTHAFLRPERLANGRCGSARPVRARAISAISAAVTADPKLLDIGCSLEDVIMRLRALPGVGEWTAEYIALRGTPTPFQPPTSASRAPWPTRRAYYVRMRSSC